MRELCRLEVSCYVFVGRDQPQARSREQALLAVVEAAEALRTERLVLELDDSIAAADRRVLARAVRGQPAPIRYEHMRPHDEPGLWISDAVAWCWQHPQWRSRISPIVVDATDV